MTVRRTFATSALRVCALAFFLVGCASSGGPGYVGMLGEQKASLVRIDTLYGNYLAAQEAARRKDSHAAANYYASALKRDPDNLHLLDRAFLFEVSAGNKPVAQKLASRLARERAAHPIAQVTLALGEIERGRMGRAREHLEASAHGLYNGFAVDLIKAWTFAAQDKFDEAEKSLAARHVLGRENVLSNYHLGLIHDLYGHPEKAERHYLEALDASSLTAIRVVDAYGRFLERSNRATDALALYDRFLSDHTENVAIKQARQRAAQKDEIPPRLVSKVSHGAAEAVYSVAGLLAGDRHIDLPVLYLQIALWTNADLHQARLLMGGLFWQGEQYERTARTLAAIPPGHPFAPEAAVQIALSLERMGRFEASRKVLQTAIANYPNDATPFIALGDVLRANEKYEHAVGAYDRAFEIVGPEEASWFLFYSRGASLEQAGFWNEAEADLLAALERAPDQPIILNHLGYSWVDRGLRLEEGLDLVRTAVDLSPGNGFIVDSLGWAHYRLGNFDTAIKYLERALELEPEDPTLQEHLGDAYWMAGRKKEARFQWRHALDRDPAEDQVEKIRAKLADGLAAPEPMT